MKEEEEVSGGGRGKWKKKRKRKVEEGKVEMEDWRKRLIYGGGRGK